VLKAQRQIVTEVAVAKPIQPETMLETSSEMVSPMPRIVENKQTE
jgi:hypothetical protein